MIPFRTQVKFFLENPETVDQSVFTGVFQTWIQGQVTEELLIDVADYRHVIDGPGIVLIGHESDYSTETRDGRLGLLYTRKRQSEGDLQSQLRTSLRLTLKACERLESETAFTPRLKFRADEIEIRFADRLQLPNRPETFDQIKGDLEAVLTELYGGSGVQIAQVANDPRQLFTVQVQSAGAVSIADLLHHFQLAGQ